MVSVLQCTCPGCGHCSLRVLDIGTRYPCDTFKVQSRYDRGLMDEWLDGGDIQVAFPVKNIDSVL